jgi:transcriptional regulator with XRE-family HTH domain
MARFSGPEVRRRRTDLELSEVQLAALIDKTQRTVQNYEAGRQFPTPASLVRLAAALDCQIADLFTDDDDTADPAQAYLNAQRRAQGFGDHLGNEQARADAARLLKPSRSAS